MNKKDFINDLKRRGFISGSECRKVVREFLETYEINGWKIAEQYDLPRIYQGIMRDVQKACWYESVGEGTSKRYFYDKQEVLDYLTSLDW